MACKHQQEFSAIFRANVKPTTRVLIQLSSEIFLAGSIDLQAFFKFINSSVKLLLSQI